MKNIRIVTLAENCVYGKHLQGEHGLSIYIETAQNKILFDTGASDLFIRNAEQLGIDLKQIDYLILSHGHNDHTGGLLPFIKLNSKARIVCKKEIFTPKYKGDRENGLFQTDILLNPTNASRFQTITENTEIFPGAYVIPHLTIYNNEDTHFDHFEIIKDNRRIPDCFEDEVSLVLTTRQGIVVLSACSHRGITNIIRTILNLWPNIPLYYVLGGFHIHKAPESKTNFIGNFFSQYPNCHIGICHCTGVDQYAILKAQLGNRLFYNFCGMEINIPE